MVTDVRFRYTSGGWNAASIRVEKLAGSDDNGTMLLRTTGHSIPQLFLDQSGSVGIGYSGTLSDRLVVAGTGSFQGIKILSGASDGYVLTSDASGNARWATPSGGNSWSLSGNTV